MLELYFLFYRVPKMMTRRARERNRSAVAWTLIGVAAWIVAEFMVAFLAGVFYAIGIELWDWPERSSGFNLVTYFLALGAALVSVTIVSRILTRQPRPETLPPPPPQFPAAEPTTVE